MPDDPVAPGAARLIAAIDTTEPEAAARLSDAVRPHTALIKLGLEFFVANGPGGVAQLDPSRVFLDLKLHDIPATVRGAARAAARLGCAMLTVHAAGGAAMIAAARAGLDEATAPGRTRTRLLAVTVLTSLDDAALRATGVADDVATQVERLAGLALGAGADGLVCSAAELRSLRRRFGSSPTLVVPGIRPDGDAVDDQARVATPATAIRDGASFLVMGRPISRAGDVGAAARGIADAIARALMPDEVP